MTQGNTAVSIPQADVDMELSPSEYRAIQAANLDVYRSTEPGRQDRRAILSSESGPAFDGLHNRPLATELARSLQAQGLSVCGDVLDALDRKCVSDLVDAWMRLRTVLRLDFQPINIAVGPWGKEPYARLTASVVQAMCHADLTTATVKWVSADAAIRAYVRSHRDAMAKELHGETHLSDLSILEDGATDQSRVAFLQQQIDRFSAFAAGVR